MNKKGQAAMEFLMTYGWAIIIVLAAIGALAYFGVLSPAKLLPERTVFAAPIPNLDNAIITGTDLSNTVEISFQNNKGVAIEINGTVDLRPKSGTTCAAPVLSGTYNGAPMVLYNGANKAAATQIPNGGKFLLKWDCTDLAQAASVGDKFGADMSFKYLNVETDQVATQVGSVDGKYQ